MLHVLSRLILTVAVISTALYVREQIDAHGRRAARDRHPSTYRARRAELRAMLTDDDGLLWLGATDAAGDR